MDYRLDAKGVLRDGAHVFHTDGEGLLLSYEGPGGEVRVPRGVDTIAAESFAFCTDVTSVVLPEGVRAIRPRAFYRSGIRFVFLPGTLKTICELAFSETPLETVELPDSVTELEEMAFRNAECLKTARLPEGLTSLNPEVFACCVSLKEVVLPGTLKYIQAGAFMNCAALETVALPESLVAVWTQAFCGCTSLREIRLGDNVEAIGDKAFQDCVSLETVRIPEKTTMTWGDAFENCGRLSLTGPGQKTGIDVSKNPPVYYDPGLKKLTVPEGVTKLRPLLLRRSPGLEVLDLPRSLRLYSWFDLRPLMSSLRRIVTDRDAVAAEIALLLDIECVDREGRPFTFTPPERHGRWQYIPDEERGGLSIIRRNGEIGLTADACYTTMIIPDRIDGKPVTCIGAYAFEGDDCADAVYVPDSVRMIESLAFAHNQYCRNERDSLFLRLPRGVSIAENAFEDTRYFTKDTAVEYGLPEAADPADSGPDCAAEAEKAADDPSVGTGIADRSALKPNLWNYLDRLTREERIRELTHFFRITGEIDGVGWATVKITLDGENARFRISDIGNSPADFRKFALEISNGSSVFFGWSAEPGSFRWSIERRGGIFHVTAPCIRRSFFIPCKAFLDEVLSLTDDW